MSSSSNPLLRLQEFGQSVWFDNIGRGLISSGQLKRYVDEDGLRGVTSNPAIFEKAIAHSRDYDTAIAEATASGRHPEAQDLFEHLAIEDIRMAADVLRGVYDATQRGDGYVSLEVSPLLAHDTAATLAEARRLWKAVGRPNVMIKIPGTPAGVPAIRDAIRDGVNINVTLLFSIAAYEAVADAFVHGLEARAAAGADIAGVASVASFFVSRIDTMVDAEAAKRLETEKDPAVRSALQAVAGKTAVANARLAYQVYKRRIAEPRWRALAAKGAMPQRLLWASTGTKNPAYSDVLYVEELIGPETVNTLPNATFDAFRDHGKVAATLDARIDEAKATMAALAKAAISLDAVTDQLLSDAVRLFADPFRSLLGALEAKRRALSAA